MPQDFIVDRSNLRDAKFSDAAALTVGDGEVVVAIERFALTANNITYGVAGDIIGYWNFFPAPKGWGRIPVWGIGRVSSSAHPDVREGDRYYGYFPMSDELLVRPDGVSPRGFTDGAAHRAALPTVYNQYSLMTPENGFDLALDNHQMLYRPLFTTSFVLDDYFRDNDFFGAGTVILGSASSKTAFGLAFMLQRSKRVKVIGLTSPANVSFVRQLGLYDEVLTYDDVESLPSEPSAYVDMAGNRDVLAAVHHHLKEKLVNSCGVGITHWEAQEGADPASLPGAKQAMFFAPTQIVKRSEELGPAEYQRRIAEATGEFFARVDAWVTIDEHPFTELASVYDTVLNGPSPDRGYVVTVA
jgi:hypothetical protein